MKKILVLLAIALLTSACSDEIPEEEALLPIDGEASFQVNGELVAPNDTLYFVSGESATFELLINQKKMSAFWEFGSDYEQGSLKGFLFDQPGEFKLKAILENHVYFLNVIVENKYHLKINDSEKEVHEINQEESLDFQVLGSSGREIYSYFDLGDGRKIKGQRPSASYDKDGNYQVKATFKNRYLNTTVKVRKIPEPTEPSIILLDWRLDNGFIYGTLGLKAASLPNWTPNKKTYLTGEISGAYWKDYEITERQLVGQTTYLKFNFSCLPGKFRISWIQLKDGYTEFNYDNCNWAWDPASPFWSSDNLFVFYLRIEDNKVVIED